jgi:hypothetical protein
MVVNTHRAIKQVVLEAKTQVVEHGGNVVNVEPVRKLFSHLRQEASLLEISHGAVHNQLVQVNFLNLGVDPRNDPLNKSPDVGAGSDIQTRHLLAGDFVRSFQ